MMAIKQSTVVNNLYATHVDAKRFQFFNYVYIESRQGLQILAAWFKLKYS